MTLQFDVFLNKRKLSFYNRLKEQLNLSVIRILEYSLSNKVFKNWNLIIYNSATFTVNPRYMKT